MTPDCRRPVGAPLWAPPLALSLLATFVWLGDWNAPLFLSLNHLGAGTSDWAGLTLFGEPLVALALGLVCFARRPQAGWALILGGLVTALVVTSIKSGLGLPRPLAVLPPEHFHQLGAPLRWRAMPSGHTATAFLFAAVVFWCADYRIMQMGALLLAILAGLSRIMVGAHWPLDVLVGAALGWLGGALGVWLADRWAILYRGPALFLAGAILAGSALSLFFYRSDYPQAHGLQIAIGAFSLTAAALAAWHRSRRPR